MFTLVISFTPKLCLVLTRGEKGYRADSLARLRPPWPQFIDRQSHILDSQDDPASHAAFPEKDAIERHPPVSLAVTVGYQACVRMKNRFLYVRGTTRRHRCNQETRSSKRSFSRTSGRNLMSDFTRDAMSTRRLARPLKVPIKLPIKLGRNTNLHPPMPPHCKELSTRVMFRQEEIAQTGTFSRCCRSHLQFSSAVLSPMWSSLSTSGLPALLRHYHILI